MQNEIQYQEEQQIQQKDTSILKIETIDEKLQKNISLKSFLHNAFSILNPSCDFLWNWHIEYLCDVLEQVAKGEIKRVLINIPPRYLKSVICSVAFPSWLIGIDPTKRVIVASYSKTLAQKHSTDCRIVMQSEWYKKTFPHTQIAVGSNEKMKFCTTQNGFRFATSTGGTLTGEGGDILILDDPHNPVGIYNKQNRKKVVNWFTGVFSSRLNNKRNGAMIVIMQRLHCEDLSGYILEQNEKIKERNKNSKSKNKQPEWFCIELPAIAEEECNYTLFDKNYKTRKVGNILHPRMEGQQELATIKSELGEYNFSAQYQQNPIALDGNMIKQKWLKYFKIEQIITLYNKDSLQYYISIDCASGLGTENDFTAIAVFTIQDCKFYLVKMHRLKIQYPDLKNKIVELIDTYKPKVVLIEDKSNGSSMIQDLNTQYNFIIPIKPTKSKELRVNDILTTLEAGNLLIAEAQDWTAELESELLSFPACKHDDQVDTISQFINWYNTSRKQPKTEIRIRTL